MLEARKACYLKVIAATMKPPARPDKSPESIQPVQSTQPVQTNQLEQQAKPVQPVQPVVQANQQLQSTRSSRSALSLSPTPVNKFNSPRHSVPTVPNGVTNGMIGSQSSVSSCGSHDDRAYMYYIILCRINWIITMVTHWHPHSKCMRNLLQVKEFT